MAEICGFIGLSHSPFWDRSLEVEGPGRTFVDGVRAAKRRIEDAKPDALVVFGPDHFRNFFYDVLPAFCIGVEKVSAFGDYDIAAGPLPVAAALGRSVFAGVTAAGFDPAWSLKMGVDHGIVQAYDVLSPGRVLPIVPIMVNCGGAPRPSMARCIEFGRAAGNAIRAFPAETRVMILASGGLSHWVRPVSEEDPRTSPDIREYTIEGRPRAHEYSAMRDASVRDRKEAGVESRVNDTWDRWFLERIAAGDLDALAAISSGELEAEAGNGGHEVRAWLAGVAAYGRPVSTLSYEAVPAWATGMACSAA